MAWELEVEVAVGSAVGVALGGESFFDDDVEGFTEELSAEGEGVFGGDGGGFGDSGVGFELGDEVVGPAGGGGVGTGGVWESVNMDEAGVADEGGGFAPVAVVFAWEAGDDVGGEGGTVEGGVEVVDKFSEIAGGVLAVHAAEDFIGTGLEGEVEMGDDLRAAGEGGEEVWGEVAGFEGGESEAGKFGNLLGEGVDEFGEVVAAWVVLTAAKGGGLAEGTEEDSGEDDFVVTGLDEGSDLGDGIGEGHGPEVGAELGDDAVGAVCVAAVLDFEVGALAGGLSAELGEGEA